MAILVTGGAGYVGSHVVRQLSDSGIEVIVVDNLVTGFKDSLINNEIFIEGAIHDETVMERAFSTAKIEGVIHLAASQIVPESVSDPLKYYYNNVGSMAALLRACMKYKVNKIVFSSAAAVYGSPESGYSAEEDPRRPDSPYGASKAMAERILKDSAEAYGIQYVILRIFNVAGADPKGRMGQRSAKATHLIKICCEAATGKRKFVEIFGQDFPTLDGTSIRDYVHVEDVAAAHLLALDAVNEKKCAKVLNVGYGKGMSVKDVISTTWQVSGKSFRVKIAKRRPGDSEKLVARVDKIKALGWRPQYNDIEKIISDAYNFEKSLK